MFMEAALRLIEQFVSICTKSEPLAPAAEFPFYWFGLGRLEQLITCDAGASSQHMQGACTTAAKAVISQSSKCCITCTPGTPHKLETPLYIFQDS